MKSILIIDDDLDMGEALELLLTEEGYQVRRASSGKQGMEMATAETPHLILLDWQMPQMNGEQVLAELNANPVLAKVDVMLMSANINHIPAEALRFRQHVAKPCNLEQLLKQVAKIFHGYSKAPRKKGET